MPVLWLPASALAPLALPTHHELLCNYFLVSNSINGFLSVILSLKLSVSENKAENIIISN